MTEIHTVCYLCVARVPHSFHVEDKTVTMVTGLVGLHNYNIVFIVYDVVVCISGHIAQLFWVSLCRCYIIFFKSWAQFFWKSFQIRANRMLTQIRCVNNILKKKLWVLATSFFSDFGSPKNTFLIFHKGTYLLSARVGESWSGGNFFENWN